jgi:glucosylceramidase
MAHFSKFMRPGAVKIGCTINSSELVSTAVQNPDGTIAVAIFNPTLEKQNLALQLKDKIKNIEISSKALQTVLIEP